MRAFLLLALTTFAACTGSPQKEPVPDAGSLPDGGQTVASKRAATFPDLTDGGTPRNAEHPRLAVDGQGVTHVLYTSRSAEGSGEYSVRYGQCAGDCGTQANWHFRALGDHGRLGGLARLAVTPGGAVRAVWVRASGGAPVVVLAACDGACLADASWAVGEVSTEVEVSEATVGDDPLRVDANGGLALVLGGPGGFRYGTCAAGCTDGVHWTWTRRPHAPIGWPTLALTPEGKPRVLGSQTAVGGGDILGLESCETACDTAAGWTTTTLYWGQSAGRHALQADAQGTLKAAFYQGVTGQAGVAATEEHVLYAECATGCVDAAKWSAVSVGLDPRWGAEGLGLTLDEHGLPVLAVSTQPSPYTVAWVACTADCATAQGAWVDSVVEKEAALSSSVPPPPPACDGGQAYWYPGEHAAVAWVPGTATLEVMHIVYTLETCGLGTPTTRGVSWPRFAQVVRN